MSERQLSQLEKIASFDDDWAGVHGQVIDTRVLQHAQVLVAHQPSLLEHAAFFPTLEGEITLSCLGGGNFEMSMTKQGSAVLVRERRSASSPFRPDRSRIEIDFDPEVIVRFLAQGLLPTETDPI